MLKHFFRYFKVGDNAVLHRADGDDVARRTAKHLFCVAPDGFNLVRNFVDRYDRRLGHDDASAFRINKRVCCSEIYCQIAGK